MNFFLGCNMFSDMHGDVESEDYKILLADGQAALNREEYSTAMTCFNKAIKVNSKSSEARWGYVQAYFGFQQVDRAEFIQEIFNKLQSEDWQEIELIKLSVWNKDDYQALVDFFEIIISVLEPILQGETQGYYTSKNTTLNINSGFFYILQVAAKLKQANPEGKFKKIVYDDNEILWLVDGQDVPILSGDPEFLLPKLEAGLNCFKVVSENTKQPGISSIIEIFEEWQTIIQQL